jgi:hypothetical protein
MPTWSSKEGWLVGAVGMQNQFQRFFVHIPDILVIQMADTSPVNWSLPFYMEWGHADSAMQVEATVLKCFTEWLESSWLQFTLLRKRTGIFLYCSINDLGQA